MHGPRAGQGHGHRKTAAHGFGQDFSQQDHQHGEADGKQGQGDPGHVVVVKHCGGIAAQHQAAKDVEAVVGNHQHRQGAAQALAQLIEPASAAQRLGAVRQFVHPGRVHREDGRFYSRSQGRACDHDHHQQRQGDNVVHSGLHLEEDIEPRWGTERQGGRNAPI